MKFLQHSKSRISVISLFYRHHLQTFGDLGLFFRAILQNGRFLTIIVFGQKSLQINTYKSQFNESWQKCVSWQEQQSCQSFFAISFRRWLKIIILPKSGFSRSPVSNSQKALIALFVRICSIRMKQRNLNMLPLLDTFQSFMIKLIIKWWFWPKMSPHLHHFTVIIVKLYQIIFLKFSNTQKVK